MAPPDVLPDTFLYVGLGRCDHGVRSEQCGMDVGGGAPSRPTNEYLAVTHFPHEYGPRADSEAFANFGGH